MSFAMKAGGVSGGSAAFGSKTTLTLASYGLFINLKAFAHQWRWNKWEITTSESLHWLKK